MNSSCFLGQNTLIGVCMNSLRYFFLLPVFLIMGASCSHHGAEVELKDGKGVLNCEDYKQLIVAPVIIDGKKCHLLVDTGASHTLLRKDLVKKFWPGKSLKYMGGKITSNIESPLFLASVRSLSSEPLEVKNFNLLVADLPHLGKMGSAPVAGMLGMDIMGSFPMLIDVEGGKVTFFSKAPADAELKALGAVKVPIQRDGNHVRAKLLMDGKPMQLIIDTGATQSCIPRKSWNKKTKRMQSKMEWVNVNGISQINEFEYGEIDRLKWGNMTFPNMVVFFETPEKVMGGDVLRKGKLFLDRRLNQAWWIPN